MAITDSNYAELEKTKRGVLDINTSDYYFDTLRPYIQEMMRTCKADPELYRTLDKVTNAIDTLCVRELFKDIPEEIDVLNTVINDRNYFNGPMKRAPESEKEMVRDLISKISDFLMIIKCEPDVEKDEPVIKERLDYKEPTPTSPTGENMSYVTHNMKELNKTIEQKRIPNV